MRKKEDKTLANSFELHIKTSADLKSVQQLKQELQEVKKLANEGYGTGEDISKIQSTINQLIRLNMLFKLLLIQRLKLSI